MAYRVRDSGGRRWLWSRSSWRMPVSRRDGDGSVRTAIDALPGPRFAASFRPETATVGASQYATHMPGIGSAGAAEHGGAAWGKYSKAYSYRLIISARLKFIGSLNRLNVRIPVRWRRREVCSGNFNALHASLIAPQHRSHEPLLARLKLRGMPHKRGGAPK